MAYYGRKNKKGAFRFRGLKLKFTENEKKYTARASLKGFLANASHSLLTKTILPKAPLAFLNNFSRSYQTKTISKNLNRNSKANAFERLLKQKDYSKTSRAGKTKNRKRTRFLELLSKKSVLTKNAFKKALFAKVVALLKKQSSLRKKLRSQYSSTKQNSYSFLKYRTKRFKQLMRYNNTKQSRLFVSTFKRSLKKAYRVQKHLFQQRLLSVALNSNPST